jgi:hypothetical protein
MRATRYRGRNEGHDSRRGEGLYGFGVHELGFRTEVRAVVFLSVNHADCLSRNFQTEVLTWVRALPGFSPATSALANQMMIGPDVGNAGCTPMKLKHPTPRSVGNPTSINAIESCP